MTDAQLHIHLVSDSTGETVHQIARACVAQFPNVRTTEHVWTLVRSLNHVEAVFAGVERNPGVLLMSVVDADLRAEFEKRCTERHIPHVSVLDPVVHLLGSLLGQPSRNRPGGQRQLDNTNFERMAAVDFAVRHDDGLNMAELHDADILLVGVVPEQTLSFKIVIICFLLQVIYSETFASIWMDLLVHADLGEARRVVKVAILIKAFLCHFGWLKRCNFGCKHIILDHQIQIFNDVPNALAHFCGLIVQRKK
jgi:hypothetical protein